MRHRTRVLLAAGCALLAGTAGTAAAQLSISVPHDLLTWRCGNPTSAFTSACGQSFMAPASHTVLQSFTFRITTSSELQLRIFAHDAVMSGPALFEQAVAPTGEIASPRTVMPPGGLSLAPGTLYLALLFIDPGEQVVFQANPGNAYADGQWVGCTVRDHGFACRNPGTLVADHDAAFDATFVSAQTTAPEPATVALLGGGLLGLAGVGAVRRRGQA